MPPPPTCNSPKGSAKQGWRSTSACTTTRRPKRPTGTFRRPITSKAGATHALSTAPSPSSSRRSRRCTAEGPRGGAHGETLTRKVEIAFADGRRKITAPLFVLPGHPDGSVTLHLGYGRTRGGRVASPPDGAVGFNAYSVWTSAAPFFEGGATVRALDERYTLACVQLHHTMDAGGLKDHKLPEDFSA